ncbi:MAG: hypothetical protein LUD46_11405 [Parabacteroides sp.]|nr:hypothetical protein [Parabacteroides sp.]
MKHSNVILFALTAFIAVSCSCNKDICNRNIQNEILRELQDADAFRKQSGSEDDGIEARAEQLFANSMVKHPDSLYNEQYNLLDGYFCGEAGQDLYYMWYAHFIAKRNKGKQCEAERKTLNCMFYCINDVLCCIAEGGTGFSHEKYRVPAYVEYYIYECREKKDLSDKTDEEINQTISTLWQIVAMYNDNDLPVQTLVSRLKYAYERIEYIKSLITNEKYLYCLQDYIQGNYMNENKNI